LWNRRPEYLEKKELLVIIALFQIQRGGALRVEL
jgi:hypothetical protein